MDIKQFKSIFPKAVNAGEWVQQLNDILPKYQINTKQRIAAFLAQCGHESVGFSVLKENLNYSADALNRVFPKYFKNAGRDANLYARKPEKIANVVYANRMGNGNEQSGDGWKFRGRGLIQLTGRTNYQRFATFINNYEIVENPDLVCFCYDYAILSAVWYWSLMNLNVYADKSDIKTMTKLINGGYNGLDDRTRLYNKILKVI